MEMEKMIICKQIEWDKTSYYELRLKQKRSCLQFTKEVHLKVQEFIT